MNLKLYQKLHEIMCETKAIEKNMTIEFKTSKYKAISESAILNEIKPLLKKYKVIILPAGVDIKQENNLTTLNTTWKIVDIESGEFEIIAAPGNGSDSQDKGTGKAFTYAYKALLQKTFMLFSGEDTDNEHSDLITENIKAQTVSGLLNIVTDKLTALGEPEMEAAILKGYKVKSLSDLTDKQLTAIGNRLDAKLKEKGIE